MDVQLVFDPLTIHEKERKSLINELKHSRRRLTLPKLKRETISRSTFRHNKTVTKCVHLIDAEEINLSENTEISQSAVNLPDSQQQIHF